MPKESAIILPVGEAEPIVSSLRRQYDKSASLGVPAHITLLYPFRPPHLAEMDVENLADFFSAIPAFEFSLSEARRFPRTAYLHPDVPERFVEIIRKLVEKWPEYQPYHGVFRDIIPHLSVAHDADIEVLEAVQQCLLQHLPIGCMAKEAWLLFSDDNGFWSKRSCFPLEAFPK
jgi:2'-5' RNA ligase